MSPSANKSHSIAGDNQGSLSEKSSQIPPFIQPQVDGLILRVKVQPRASRNQIGRVLGTELQVKVTAPPVDSAANEALLRFLGEILGCSRNRLELLRGHSSRHKTVRVRDLPLPVVVAKLKPSADD